MKNCFINNILFIYRERYPERRTPHHSFFSKSIKDCLTGHLNFHTERARERPVRNENFEEIVLNAFWKITLPLVPDSRELLKESANQQFGMYLLHENLLYAYHLQRVQAGVL
uniref:Uncharacterized protein n=1 Tax=Cacopsylla melanoneura TaxID=428564 RepID=A0A8D9BX96_9HEMI